MLNQLNESIVTLEPEVETILWQVIYRHEGNSGNRDTFRQTLESDFRLSEAEEPDYPDVSDGCESEIESIKGRIEV